MGKGRRAALLIAAWLLAFDVTAAWTPETVKAGETTELTDGTYNYTVNVDGTTATLTKYIGSEADVVIPETIGDGLTVTTLGAHVFVKNKTVKSVTLPQTVVKFEKYTTEFYGASNLEKIVVNEKNPVFYDTDGVLFEKVKSGILLVKYPEGKIENEYTVPKSVGLINQSAFQWTKNLTKITISDVVSEIWLQAFTDIKADIILTHTDANVFTIEPYSFNYLKSGSKIIVRNAEIKKKVLAAMNECADDVQVINLADLSEEEQKAYLVPATSLTWDGTNTIGKTTLSPGEKCQLSCQQLPSNTTDNVVWSSSDPAVAKVDATTGLIEASGGVNYTLKTGTTTITGTDESGHSITLEVTVLKSVTSVILSDTDKTVAFDSEDPYVYVGLSVQPYDANNIRNVVWSSSNQDVATIISNGGDFYYPTSNRDDYYYENGGKITVYKAGTTTITATLNDNGTIFTKSFVLTVTGATSTDDGIDNNSGNNSGNGGTTPGNDSSKDNDGNTGGTISTSPTHTQPIKTYIEKGKITPTTITLTYGTTAKLRVEAKGRTTCFVTNKKIAVLTSSGKLVPKNTGVTTLKVKADASGKYKGRTITYRLIVLPKKETVTYAKSLTAGQLTLKWKKDTRATGYQIQYSTSSKFAKKATKTILVKNSRITKKTIQKLSGGKKYYVRVRAYKTMKINGKKTNKYGAWSKGKTVKVSR